MAMLDMLTYNRDASNCRGVLFADWRSMSGLIEEKELQPHHSAIEIFFFILCDC